MTTVGPLERAPVARPLGAPATAIARGKRVRRAAGRARTDEKPVIGTALTPDEDRVGDRQPPMGIRSGLSVAYCCAITPQCDSL
ncbi:hypothetical protein [Nocardia brevicatena]|uniref:hypothetical protein n=1 Tax=Nocardia brevicatena TaxID=37327 RepID=UPI001C3F4939|nr:hypothetical protein [Nocardia brevicatena]